MTILEIIRCEHNNENGLLKNIEFIQDGKIMIDSSHHHSYRSIRDMYTIEVGEVMGLDNDTLWKQYCQRNNIKY